MERWACKVRRGNYVRCTEKFAGKKFIETLAGEGRKKEYVITALGKQIVEAEVTRIKELYNNGKKIIQAEGDV